MTFDLGGSVRASGGRRPVDVTQHEVEASVHPVAMVTRRLCDEPDQGGEQSEGCGQEEEEERRGAGGGGAAAGSHTVGTGGADPGSGQ